MTELWDPAPIGWREARLDLLLAEELSVDADFSRWFVEAALANCGVSLPGGAPSRVDVRFNVWDDIAGVDDAGENDLDVMLWWGNRGVCVLVENKVWAILQPRQAERYRARARVHRGAAILVAPRRYLSAHADDAAKFDGQHSLEDIAARLRGTAQNRESVARARYEWRAALVEELAAPPKRSVAADHPPTVAFCAYCCDWLGTHAPTARPNPRMLHTENQGWLWFNHPTDLGYKVTHGVVDLYVAVNGFGGTVADLAAVLEANGGPPEDFEPAVDGSGNVVLRYTASARVPPAAGVPADPAVVRVVLEGLDACRRATEWFDAHGARVLAAPPLGSG